MKEKRGLSAVVTNLLIILLSLVAIGVVWVVVSNLINQGAEGISLDEFSYDLDIDAAYVQNGGVDVVVGRNAGGGNLSGVAFIFHNGTDSVVIKRLGFFQELDTRTFTFTSSELSEITNLNLVSVAPIYQSGGSSQTGNILDTREIGTSVSGGGNPPGGAVCGNGNIEGIETCDDGDTSSGDGCSYPACQIETPPSCDNDNQIDSGEYCDGTALGVETCQTLGYDLGDLLCNSNCAFDISQCTLTQDGGATECSDSLDNDGDGSTDLADIGCVDADDNDETNCGDGICEGGETTSGCSLDCQLPPPPSCGDGAWNQTDIDDGNQCDGTPLPANCTVQCGCLSGYVPNSNGGCVLEPVLNFGTVDSIWPGGAVKYFDSNDLPKTITITSNFTGKYVNFSGADADTRCLRISYAEY